MQVYNTAVLLHSLSTDVQTLQATLQKLKNVPEELLLAQPTPDSWSIAQVLEHLNSYNRYYLTQMEQRILNAEHKPKPQFKPGWLGNYFTGMMQPQSANKVGKKYTAPKEHVPAPDLDAQAVLLEFEHGTGKLLNLLKKAHGLDIGNIRIPITLTPLIRLKLGDTFRFLIAHQQRHFVQIGNVVGALEIAMPETIQPHAGKPFKEAYNKNSA